MFLDAFFCGKQVLLYAFLFAKYVVEKVVDIFASSEPSSPIIADETFAPSTPIKRRSPPETYRDEIQGTPPEHREALHLLKDL